MEIRLKTLTPLWTGGVDGTCDRLHETGIIGSLRWWYEVIVRGLGGMACNAVSDPRCPTKVKVGTSEKQVWCVACDLFGCTGWGRRFRLRLAEDGTQVYAQRDQRDQINFRPSGRNRGWYYGAGRLGDDPASPELHGQLIVLREDRGAVINQLIVPLALVGAWGGLGARTQHGFGVVQATAWDGSRQCAAELDRFLSYIEAKKAEHSNAPNVSAAPRLDEFFFSRFRFSLTGEWWKHVDGLRTGDGRLRAWVSKQSVPVAPAIKNQLRFGAFLPTVRSYQLEDELFGALSPRQAAKIHVSSAYPLGDGRWEVRVWGWIPGSLQQREQVLNELHAALTKPALWNQALGTTLSHVDYEWKEQGNPPQCQPPCPEPCTTTADFLRCLLGG